MNPKTYNQVKEFFQTTDWNLFYQSKMALCELVDHFCGSDDKKEQNAVEWIESLLNMMDGLGDIAEEMGLFSYPERDENDECLDDRFNNVLDKLPEEYAPAVSNYPANDEMFMVTLRRIRLEDAFHPEIYEDDFVMKIPREISESERSEYAKTVFRNMAHDMLTGPSTAEYIVGSVMDFNWGDCIALLSDELKAKYQCYDYNEGCPFGAAQHITVDVCQDEILLPNDEPCVIRTAGKEEQAVADMLIGAVYSCNSKAVLNIDADATITFLTGEKATLPLASSREEAEETNGTPQKKYFWFAQK